MKIGICDDDVQELSRISSFIEKYKNDRKIVITYKAFKNGLELIDTMTTCEYELLMLDILMPGISGMQAAKEIRRYDENVKIIFLTSAPEFAVESYGVDAYHYLLKPASEEMLFPILDKLIAELRKPAECLNIKKQSGVMRIPFYNIEYVDVYSKTVSFHMNDGEVYEVYGSLKDFESNLLKKCEFIKVHRSYIVNMKWINKLGIKEILMENQSKIPVSRSLYTFVRDTYMKYLFIEKDIK